jgi:hypothetical protein
MILSMKNKCVCFCLTSSCVNLPGCMVSNKVELLFIVQTSLRELTTLGIKNAENLSIPSVRNDVRFLPVSR